MFAYRAETITHRCTRCAAVCDCPRDRTQGDLQERHGSRRIPESNRFNFQRYIDARLCRSSMTNHVHLLIRTVNAPLSALMRRLLTGCAITFNRRHRRHGQLFQNRYKSIRCQEDGYLLERTRYIHLNPLRAGIIDDLAMLDGYRFTATALSWGSRKRR